jgi:hypothetical protein
MDFSTTNVGPVAGLGPTLRSPAPRHKRGHKDDDDWQEKIDGVCWCNAPRFSASRRSRTGSAGLGRERVRGNRRSRVEFGAINHFALARWRPEPVGDLGPEARCPRGRERPVPPDRDAVPWSKDMRTSAANGRAYGSVGACPVYRRLSTLHGESHVYSLLFGPAIWSPRSQPRGRRPCPSQAPWRASLGSHRCWSLRWDRRRV